MDADRYRKVQELFEAALGIGVAQRDAFLRQETKSDPQLGREVESLLAAVEAAHTGDAFSEERIADTRAGLGELIPGPTGALARVGDDRILGVVGQGGMGVVYEAEQRCCSPPSRSTCRRGWGRSWVSSTTGGKERTRSICAAGNGSSSTACRAACRRPERPSRS